MLLSRNLPRFHRASGFFPGRLSPFSWNLFSTSQVKSSEDVRVGCGSGFWGDTPTAIPQLLKSGEVDFLMLDYLSEVTMSLLTAAKEKNPNLGWCPDFVQSLAPLLPLLKGKGIKVVTNAGGVNPTACMNALLSLPEGKDLKVALITGDDLRDRPIEGVENISSANAYLGAGPIARALDLGADIVITGRCTDSALALAPLMHKFKWSPSDYNLMATGSLAGHLIECGAQSTGGIFTDWDSVPSWENNGFPIAVCSKDGHVKITKPKGTGGLINKGTVSEQLLYEIGNPARYALPDVICDFSNVTVKENGDGTVSVEGAKGLPPTKFYKVGGTFQDGWKCTAVCPIIGPRAREKGRKTAEALLTRSNAMFKFFGLPPFIRSHIQILGSEEAYGAQARQQNLETRDAVLWFSVHHKEKKACEIFAREIASAGTGMAPGLTAVIGGRPRPAPVHKFFSYLQPKAELKVEITLNDGHKEEWKDTTEKYTELSELEKDMEDNSVGNKPEKGSHSYRLSELAYLRSGDKGDSCNIGVISRDPQFYPYIRAALTKDKVLSYFDHKFQTDRVCKRYSVPGIYGLNFLLENSLGGGGIASLNADPQGKGYAQMLADFVIENVPKLK